MTTRSISRSGLLISVCLGLGCGSAAPASSTGPTVRGAELALVGGDLHTMNPASPHATAIAIGHGKILAIGSDADIAKFVDAGTREIDLHGATVTPGLIDAHAHLLELGSDLSTINVRDLPDEVAVTRVVAAAANKDRGASRWLVGRGWDQTRWPGDRFPTKASLDAVVPDQAVVLGRIDGHAAWVNSAGLRRAGITKTTPDPSGGTIVRDVRGEPTGLLLDNAMDLVERSTGSLGTDEIEHRLRLAARYVVALGITAVHEMGVTEASISAYEHFTATGAGGLRIAAYYKPDYEDPRSVARLAKPPAAPSGTFTLRGVKLFADGALGSRGARLAAPYADDAKTTGLWVTDPTALATRIDAAVAHGWQVAVHAIGDAAVGVTLDSFLATSAKHPGDLRLRVEHAQVVAPADFAKFVASHAVASMQPVHATSDMRWAEARLGLERIRGAYAWRTMLDHHIHFAAGSDFPFDQVAPILGIYAAVTRQDPDGNPGGGWYAAQRLSLDEALAAYTTGAAYASFSEANRGMLAVGRDADLVVFDAPFTIDAHLAKRTVDMTLIDGIAVYDPHSRVAARPTDRAQR